MGKAMVAFHYESLSELFKNHGLQSEKDLQVITYGQPHGHQAKQKGCSEDGKLLWFRGQDVEMKRGGFESRLENHLSESVGLLSVTGLFPHCPFYLSPHLHQVPWHLTHWFSNSAAHRTTWEVFKLPMPGEDKKISLQGWEKYLQKTYLIKDYYLKYSKNS